MESLVVDRVEVVLLDGRLLLSKVLVEDHVVLLKLELWVGRDSKGVGRNVSYDRGRILHSMCDDHSFDLESSMQRLTLT